MTKFKVPKGSIVFQNDRDSIYSRAINLQTSIEKRFKQRGRIGHVAIGLGDVLDTSLILEADNVIVDVNFAEKYQSSNHYLEVFNVSRHVDHRDINRALKAVTDRYKLQKYGKGQILGFVGELLLKPFGFTSNPFKSGVICSELGYLYLRELGFTVDIGDIDLITPTDLYELCLVLFEKPDFVKDYDSAAWRYTG